MVPPADPESNFGVVERLLFSRINLPAENIHRVKGENDPEAEALSYSGHIREKLERTNGWPVFQLIILGMGDDGHTASIFPDQLNLLDSDQICTVATHPVSGQKRVTLTGKAINNAEKICFLLTGSNKAHRLMQIFSQSPEAKKLPASYIAMANGSLEWYVDEAAVQKLG